MTTASPPVVAVPQGLDVPIDPSVLARMASALFSALPGTPPSAIPGMGQATPIVGVQAPVNVAPPGSPLVSPAGLGPGVPGTPIPQGLAPGANLAPASPAPLPSLAHRAPALLPHAQAGNGLPDNVVTAVPAYEPRFGAGATGIAPGAATIRPDAGAGESIPYYFLEGGQSHPARPGTVLGATAVSDDLAGLAVPARAATPAAPAPPAAAAASPDPRYYFVDAVVLPSGYVTPAHPQARTAPHAGADAHPPFDVHAVRRDFPVLRERVNGRPLVWFDNAATTHKPQSVIDRIAYFYAHENSNIHRAAHELAARATDAYEAARNKVARFIGASSPEEIVFVRGTTEAINLVAKTWGAQNVGEGDEIVVSHLEHHANIVPWQQLAAAKGAKLRVIPVDDSGQVLLDEARKLITDKVKIVSVTQVSNALGTVVPVKEIVAMAHAVGAKALVDGAQSVSHMRVNVQEIDADFFVFSGHKIFGPTGIGAVYGKRAVLEQMPPWQGGGNMIADVTFERTVYQAPPNRFEAGTGNIADAVGLGAALDYVERIGIENIGRYEHQLLEYATGGLKSISGVRLIGTAADKASVASFVLKGYTTEEVGKALNREGIAVRTGHHCAQPILRRFGVETTVRPSLAFYNTCEEIDLMISVLRRLARDKGGLSAR